MWQESTYHGDPLASPWDSLTRVVRCIRRRLPLSPKRAISNDRIIQRGDLLMIGWGLLGKPAPAQQPGAAIGAHPSGFPFSLIPVSRPMLHLTPPPDR